MNWLNNTRYFSKSDCDSVNYTNVKSNESGRSMVEMLTVLAIMAVLSVVGVFVFGRAMDKHRANTIIQEANKRAVLVVPQIGLTRNENPIINAFRNNELDYAEFDNDVITTGLTGQFGIKVSGISKNICQNILNTIGDHTVIRRLSNIDTPTITLSNCGETNAFLMVYNNDMSAKPIASDYTYDDCPESFYQCATTHSCVANQNNCPNICALEEELSTGCVCPEHRDKTDDKCGDCVDEEIYQPWTQPILTSNGTMGGNNTFACAASSTIGGPRQAWRAFDGSNADAETDCWHSTSSSTSWLSWYTKNPIKINSITIINRSFFEDSCLTGDSAVVKDFKIQYSDNNSSWETAYTGTNPQGCLISTTYSINAPSAHRYWRLYVTSNHTSINNYITVGELTINADEFQVTEYTLNPETLMCE